MPRRWAATPVAALVFAAGVWAAGALPSHFKTAMALTAAWYVVAFLVAGRRRELVIGVAFAAVPIGAFLAWSTLRDRVVHERVATGPVLVSGTFRSLEHETTGRAAIVGHRLTLTGFRTSPGPDLRVRLGSIDLGALKGNVGDQQYALPAGARRGTVTIWCRAFSAAFGEAVLR